MIKNEKMRIYDTFISIVIEIQGTPEQIAIEKCRQAAEKVNIKEKITTIAHTHDI
jgi:hypothetical protein